MEQTDAEDAIEAVTAEPAVRRHAPTAAQLKWLQRGLDQPGGKLPLFDRIGQKVSEQTVRSCIRNGWAEPWFNNPIKPDWLVCRLTDAGRGVAESGPRVQDDAVFD